MSAMARKKNDRVVMCIAFLKEFGRITKGL